MTRRTVTIYDIAEAAETSVSTVSRALSGSSLVSDAVRDRVSRLARELGYRQRQIRRPARSVLNVIVFLPKKEQPEYHLFYDAAELFAGVKMGLGDTSAHTIAALNSSRGPFSNKKLGDIDGCLFAFCEPDEETEEELARRGIPVVLLNRISDRFACVVNDATAGFSALGSWVVDHFPAAAPLYLATEEQQPIAAMRLDALRRTPVELLRKAQARLYPSVRDLPSTEVRRLLDAGHTWFVCVNDLVATALCERLLRVGVRVPEEAVVTGYDNAPVRSLLETPIPTVDLAVPQLAARAAERLLEAILSREDLSGTEFLAGEAILPPAGSWSDKERIADKEEP